MNGEGRIRRGWRLLGQSTEFLRERPRMLALPALSAVLLGAAGAVLALTALQIGDGRGWAFFVVYAVAGFPLAVVANFLNVAFLAMAADAAAGYEPTVTGGLRAAEERLGPIVAWSALSTGVGVVLQAIQQIPGVGGWVARLVAVAGGLAWSVATFFVVPIIVLHGTGAREAIRRSAETFRERWGETLTGNLTIGAAMAVVFAPAGALLGAGVAAWNAGDRAVGAPLAMGGMTLIMAAAALSGALTVLFQLFLYRYVALGAADGPFAVADLERAVRPKRRPFWRR
jgi:hypothetical protein